MLQGGLEQSLVRVLKEKHRLSDMSCTHNIVNHVIDWIDNSLFIHPLVFKEITPFSVQVPPLKPFSYIRSLLKESGVPIESSEKTDSFLNNLTGQKREYVMKLYQLHNFIANFSIPLITEDNYVDELSLMRAFNALSGNKLDDAARFIIDENNNLLLIYGIRVSDGAPCTPDEISEAVMKESYSERLVMITPFVPVQFYVNTNGPDVAGGINVPNPSGGGILNFEIAPVRQERLYDRVSELANYFLNEPENPVLINLLTCAVLLYNHTI